MAPVFNPHTGEILTDGEVEGLFDSSIKKQLHANVIAATEESDDDGGGDGGNQGELEKFAEAVTNIKRL